MIKLMEYKALYENVAIAVFDVTDSGSAQFPLVGLLFVVLKK